MKRSQSWTQDMGHAVIDRRFHGWRRSLVPSVKQEVGGEHSKLFFCSLWTACPPCSGGRCRCHLTLSKLSCLHDGRLCQETTPNDGCIRGAIGSNIDETPRWSALLSLALQLKFPKNHTLNPMQSSFCGPTRGGRKKTSADTTRPGQDREGTRKHIPYFASQRTALV